MFLRWTSLGVLLVKTSVVLLGDEDLQDEVRVGRNGSRESAVLMSACLLFIIDIFAIALGVVLPSTVAVIAAEQRSQFAVIGVEMPRWVD